MTRFLVFATAVATVLTSGSAKDAFPSYFKKCSRSVPDLNKCFADNGNLAIPTLAKGDKKFHFPVLEPLRINEIAVDPSGSFHMGLKNVDVYGLGKTIITKAQVIFEDSRIILDLLIPDMEIIGEYETKGRILVLPIEGTGPANLHLFNGTFVVTTDFERFQRDGKTYLKVKKSDITYELEHGTYRFDNLFNGNKHLGDEMNRFLNENWRELSDEFNPAIKKTIVTVADGILNGLLNKIPEDDIYEP